MLIGCVADGHGCEIGVGEVAGCSAVGCKAVGWGDVMAGRPAGRVDGGYNARAINIHRQEWATSERR